MNFRNLFFIYLTLNPFFVFANPVEIYHKLENEESQYTLRDFNLGISFYKYGDYNRAITFLKSASLSSKSLSGKFLPDIAIGKIYLSESVYRSAMPIFSEVYENSLKLGYPGIPYRLTSLILIAETAARNYDLNSLRKAADEIRQFSESSSPSLGIWNTEKINFLGAYYLSLLGIFNGNQSLHEPLKNVVAKIDNPNISHEEQNAFKRILKYETLSDVERRMKSPITAGVLSMIIPGLGHMYVREWVHGVTAATFTLGSGALTYWAFSEKERAFGTFMALITGLFYGGQIIGSAKSADLQQQKSLRDFQDKAVKDLVPKSQFSIMPTGVQFSWSF